MASKSHSVSYFCHSTTGLLGWEDTVFALFPLTLFSFEADHIYKECMDFESLLCGPP